MARPVRTLGVPKSARRYPWDELLDGRTWECVRGEDFDGDPAEFGRTARAAARRRGLVLRVHRLDANTVRLRAEREELPVEGV